MNASARSGSAARTAILGRLREALQGSALIADEFDEDLLTAPWTWPAAERLERLRNMLAAVHGETQLSSSAQWPQAVLDALAARSIDELLLSPASAHGRALAAHIEATGSTLRLKAYDRPVEEWKDELFFRTPASLTGTLGGIAATGSLILWPTPEEPRLMSLVPPLHIALLKASEIYNNLYEVLQAQRWAEGLPTNALLVSGPSKTADIQQTLAYGAHGPSELLVLIVQDA